ncbi:Methyl-accepting chemotaxis protein [Vibrio cholerae LMA3984-4]|nr:Methyl-accepting chemotaxis protein [Vibrio cholerae LMA3984-4]
MKTAGGVMTLGFKGRIYASVVILVTISLMVLGTINMLSLKREMIDSLTTETQNKLNYHVSELEFWVKSRYEAVSRGANLFTPELSDTDNLNKVRLLAEAAQITNVIAAYEDGRSYMSMDKEGGVTTNRFKFIDRDWYQQAKSRRSPFLTEIYQDQVTGKKVISAVSPILHQGQFVGALLGDFQLDDIITQVSNMRFAGGAATLTDKNAVFFASDDPNDIGRTPSQVSPSFREMEAGFHRQESGHLSFPYLGIEFDGYYKRVNLTDDMYWTLMVFVDKATALADVDVAVANAITTGIVLIGISVGVIIFIINQIYKPLLRLKVAVLDLAQGSGDLTRRLEVNGNDDLAQISEGFNRFSGNLQNMMLQISDATQIISSSIEQLSQTAKENEQMLISHSSETDQVVTAITQMSESARTVAESVTQSNQITEAASKEAQQSLVIVNNAVSTVTSLVNDVENMSESISNMNRDANKISEVLSVIGAISEQTNLLALNAAIEAARVADEVRALAARTQNSTTEISDMLTKLLEGTDSVVGAMERTKQQCQTTADKTSEVSGSLNMMSASVSDIDDLSTQIAAATEQQSTVAAELSRNMLSIREIVESLVVSGRQTVGATESLSHSNHELEQLVGKFKLR